MTVVELKELKDDCVCKCALYPRNVHRRPEAPRGHRRGDSGLRVAEEERAPTTRGSARSTARRRRRFTSTATRASFTALAAASGGDVIKFLELHEKIGFHDAVKQLAQRFGMTMPEAGTDRRPAGERGGTREPAQGSRVRGQMVPRAAPHRRQRSHPPADRRPRHQRRRLARRWASASRRRRGRH